MSNAIGYATSSYINRAKPERIDITEPLVVESDLLWDTTDARLRIVASEEWTNNSHPARWEFINTDGEEYASCSFQYDDTSPIVPLHNSPPKCVEGLFYFDLALSQFRVCVNDQWMTP